MTEQERKLKAYEEIKTIIEDRLNKVRSSRKCRYNEGIEDILVKLDSVVILFEGGLLEHLEEVKGLKNE